MRYVEPQDHYFLSLLLLSLPPLLTFMFCSPEFLALNLEVSHRPHAVILTCLLVHEGQTVDVYADVDGVVLKGRKEKFTGNKRFLGIGVTLMVCYVLAFVFL